MINLIFMTCFIIFALLTAASMLIARFIFSYKSPDRIKSSTYECGLSPESSAKISFNIRYFNYLIIFIIFDISAIFLYPILSAEFYYLKTHAGIVISFLVFLLFALFIAIFNGFIVKERK